MFDESVHNSHFKDRLAFEVSVERSEALGLIKQITEKSSELVRLSNMLIALVQVEHESQDR